MSRCTASRSRREPQTTDNHPPMSLKVSPALLGCSCLDVSISCAAGHLYVLTLKISLTELGTKPVIVDIEDLYLLSKAAESVVAPNHKHDPEADGRRVQAAKQVHLAEAQLIQTRGEVPVTRRRTRTKASFRDLGQSSSVMSQSIPRTPARPLHDFTDDSPVHSAGFALSSCSHGKGELGAAIHSERRQSGPQGKA